MSDVHSTGALRQQPESVDHDRIDARRYRYLRDVAHPDDDIGLFVGSIEVSSWGNRYTNHHTGRDLDERVDAARHSSKTASGTHQEARSNEQGCAACATCGKPWGEST